MKSAARRSFGVAQWLVLAVAGAGLFLWALPFLSKLPIVGNLFRMGASVLPNQAGANARKQDEYGTVVG